MVCIYCGSKTSVSNSRATAEVPIIWRRRECSACGSIFTTYESPDYSSALRVQTVSKALEPFSRDKLFISLYESLSHRHSALQDATGLCDTVLKNLLKEQRAGLLSTHAVATAARQVLERFDKVAGAVYDARYMGR